MYSDAKNSMVEFMESEGYTNAAAKVKKTKDLSSHEFHKSFFVSTDTGEGSIPRPDRVTRNIKITIGFSNDKVKKNADDDSEAIIADETDRLMAALCGAINRTNSARTIFAGVTNEISNERIDDFDYWVVTIILPTLTRL